MKFSSFNIKEDLLVALEKLGYVNATPVQEVVIPKALKNENIIVQSETGTGKTHSFLIPILNNIEYNDKIQSIIICPTRELSRQTYNFICEFTKFFPELNCKIFVSGSDQQKDIQSIKNGCQIIVATPGRLNFLLSNLSGDKFLSIKNIILDEADMLVDNEFLDDIDEIINRCNKPQIEVYSATINKKVEYLLKKYIDADYVLTMSKNSTASTVNHYLLNTRHNDFNECVYKFIQIKNPYFLFVFANSQVECRALYNFLSSRKIKCGILSGELQARERKAMLRRIKANEYQVICCTDIASRGLDFDDVSDVLSVGLPNNLEYYFHRSGRTGRNFKSGNSFILYDSDHTNNLQKLLDYGYDFKCLKFNKDEIVEDSKPTKTQKRKTSVDVEYNKDIQKAIHENKEKKVKPGYKKKVKRAVDKVKQKYKRNAIKKNIRKQLDSKYKNMK